MKRALLLTVTFAVTTPLRAQAQIEIAIVPAEVGGDLPEATGLEVAQTFVEGMRATKTPSTELRPPESTAAQVSGVQFSWDDVTADDILEIARVTDAEAVVVLKADQLEQYYSVRAALFLARDGARLGETFLECPACTWNEALETITEAGRRITTYVPGLLEASVTPQGATIHIDGEPFPSSEPVLLTAGSHRLEVAHEGYDTVTREIIARAGELDEVTVTLSASAAPVVEQRRTHRVLALIFGSFSVATLVPGVLWLSLDGECHITWDENDGICPEVYNLWPQGLAFTLLGVGLLSASIALFIADHRRRHQTDQSEEVPRTLVVPTIEPRQQSSFTDFQIP